MRCQSLTELLRLRAHGAAAGARPREAIIMVYLNGGPSHMDMYDLKPEAPAEYRGEFKPIRSSVPGMTVGELLPRYLAEAEIAKGVPATLELNNGMVVTATAPALIPSSTSATRFCRSALGKCAMPKATLRPTSRWGNKA